MHCGTGRLACCCVACACARTRRGCRAHVGRLQYCRMRASKASPAGRVMLQHGVGTQRRWAHLQAVCTRRGRWRCTLHLSRFRFPVFPAHACRGAAMAAVGRSWKARRCPSQHSLCKVEVTTCEGSSLCTYLHTHFRALLVGLCWARVNPHAPLANDSSARRRPAVRAARLRCRLAPGTVRRAVTRAS